MNNIFTRQKNSIYVRNVIFGVEDSLVSTVGLLSGIAAATVPTSTVLLTGTIYVFVEAFSMAMGSFMSEEFAEEYVAKKDVSLKQSLIGGVTMFISSVVAGFVPLFPYMFFEDKTALVLSVAASLFVLFILGIVNGKILKKNIFKRGAYMAVLGGAAIGIGLLVGMVLKV